MQTPLQKKLAQLGKYLGILALVACAVIFVVGIVNGIPVLEIFMTAVSLAVSAIPEGLPAIVTIVLSIGVQRMVKKNAIIRRLPAVETLGSASIICSDKTGTLTQNRMTLVKAYPDGADGIEDITTQNSGEVRKLLMFGTLCSDGSVVFHGREEQHIGDPTETAIVLAAHKNGMPKDEMNRENPRLTELPFDSDRKLMTTINHIGEKNIVIVKGAFDMMVSRCVKGDLKKAARINEEMSQNALRVLAIAYKEIESVPKEPTSDELENGLTFLGLVGMIDPPRPEAKNAVATCRKAGIRPVMITGDHVVTASAIAKELGILREGDRAITGTELDTLTDDNFATIVDAVREGRGIYANIKKVVGFLLGTNIGEVLLVFVAMLMWHKSPLLAMQLLMINLVTDSLPAIALGMEPVEDDIMGSKPKPKDESLFAHGFGVRIVLQGVMFGALSLLAFYIGESTTGQLESGQTMAFMVLALSQVMQAYNMRSEHSLFKIGVFTNHKLNWASLASITLVVLVMCTPLSTLFGLVRLSGKLYVIGLGLIFVPIVIMELSKAIGLVKHHN